MIMIGIHFENLLAVWRLIFKNLLKNGIMTILDH